MYTKAYDNFRKGYANMQKWARHYVSSYYSDDNEVQRTEVKNLNWSVPMGHLDEDNITGEGLPPRDIMDKYGDCIDFFFDVILHTTYGKVDDHRIICYFTDEDFCKPYEYEDQTFKYVFEIR